jgi:glycosyl transferase, family 25
MSRRSKRIIKKDETISKENFLDKIDQIYYINLEKRKDRLALIKEEIKKISPNLEKVSRINAIEKENGAIGCGLSHIKALELAIEKNYNQIIILEDDFEFTKSVEEINYQINYLLNKVDDYNICSLSANIKRVKPYKNNVYIACDIQTTSSYIIHKRFFKILLDNFKEAVSIMEKNYKYTQAEIDVNWKKLQGKDKKFYVFRPVLGKQRSGYSDIEKKHVNYNC